MNGKGCFRITSVCLLICLIHPLPAQQNEFWIDVTEESLNRDDASTFAAEQCEELQELLFYPINLNRATLAQLESCGLFTAFQAQSILRHREVYGDLLSVYELASLPGFRRERLEEEAIFMTVINTAKIFPEKPQDGTLLFFAGNKHTNAENQALYPGSLWKTSLRIKQGLGRNVSVGLAYEKDPGEKGLWGYRPEHLCGYFEWRGRGMLEQLIAGNYRLKTGMGLIQGAGLMHTTEGIQSRPLLLSTLKPYAGASESLIHQGVACKLSMRFLKMVLWSSLQSIDLTLSNLASSNKNTDWSEHLRASAYHRTPAELSGRNLAYLGSAGIQLMASLGRLTLGLQFSPEINGLTGRGKDSLQYFHGPGFYYATSFQWQCRLNHTELYGEFVPASHHSSALVAGSRFHINDFLSGSIQVHWYGVSHRETFASAYTSGSHIKNEKGLLLLVHAEPFRGIRADMAVEVFEFPAPKINVKVPSSGFRFSLTLQNGSQEKILWRFRMVRTNRQQTPSLINYPGIRPLTNIQNTRLDGRLVYAAASWISWQSRLVFSYAPGKQSGCSHAALQQLSVSFKKRLKCTGQLVVYHVPSWDNRIYLHEPGLFQQFSFPVLSGTGNKITLVTSVKAGKRLTLEARGSMINEGELNQWEAGFQFRLNL